MLHNINKKQEKKEIKIKNKTFCEDRLHSIPVYLHCKDDNKFNWMNYERVDKRSLVLFPRLINIGGVDISYCCSFGCCESYTS